MKRILIIGSPGSGKSTLARKLSEKLGIPCVYLDRLFWKADWVQTPRDEFDKILKEELEKDCWIIDGNYKRTLEMRLKYADTVIWLDYPRIICLWRVWNRQGKPRPDMTENCIEKKDQAFFEFLKYIWTFKKEQNNKIETFLQKSNAKIMIIHNNKELRKFIDTL